MDARSTVLANDSLLQTVLSYLPDSYRFTALVCKRFHRIYLIAHGPDYRKTTTTLANATQTNATTRIWLNEEMVMSHRPFLCDIAAEYGTLQVLQEMRSKGHDWSEWTCAWAARRGDWEMLQWARQMNCDWTTWTCAWAAEMGQLEILIWARENGCPWDFHTCCYAARCGHLEILQWAREHGCPWDFSTCAEAARNGHLETLKWAKENGCNWDADRIIQAAGSQEVLAWIQENR